MTQAFPSIADLTSRLIDLGGYGKGAQQVFETSELVAAAQVHWDRVEIQWIQEDRSIHPKVWDKLVLIHKHQQRLQDLIPSKDLPSNYTALYALVVMSADEIQALVADGLLSSQNRPSSKALLDWTKTFRKGDQGVAKELPLTLVLQEVLTEQQEQDLLNAIAEVAERFGVEVRSGKGFKQAEVKEQERSNRASQLEEDLMKALQQFWERSLLPEREKFSLASLSDLVNGSRATFTGFIIAVIRDKKIFWKEAGKEFCLKVALDYNREESRVQRGNYKTRIKQVIELHGTDVTGLGEFANMVLSTFMSA
jgi:hypothetical protein